MPIHDWTRVPDGVFHDFHTTWIPDIKRSLINGRLPDTYYAMVEQIAGGPIPDVITLQHTNGTNGNGHPRRKRPPSGGTAVAVAEAPPQTRFHLTSESDVYAAKARSLVVRHVNDDRIVAVIEILSPGNKNRRHALTKFVGKAVEWLRSGVHLLIVDLFPPGKYDPQGIHPILWADFGHDAFEFSPRQPLTLASYLSRLEDVQAFIQPVGVGETLPECPLFLEENTYINLPLEESYLSAYATVPARWRDLLEADTPN